MSITVLKSELFHHKGGLEKYTWRILRALCDRGLNVTILTTGKVVLPPDLPNLRIISSWAHYPFSVANVIHFDRFCADYLKKNPTPIVFGLDRNRFQTHLRAGNGVHAAYLKRRGACEGFWKRCSFALNPLHHLLLHLEKQAIEQPSLERLITNSHMVKREFLSYYPLSAEKVEVIHNGVEWHEMQSPFSDWQEERPKLFKRFQLDPSRFQFLFVGHNYHRKGLEPLLQGLALLPHRDWELSVVGKEKDLPYFQHLVSTLGLLSHIHFFHSQPNLIPFYQLADALVIPSWYDPFANVTVEALAMGLFVISSQANGGREVLLPTTGATIDNLSDPLSIAASLEIALQRTKTKESSLSIRDSVRSLDFSEQLPRLISCLQFA